ncbi:MAG TPA: DUF2461 domain-containing protein [Oscillospiraceae bacterium]|nr:DUF2461 domain-containing protein [Oscillospiraceae bacterium]
MVYDGIKVEAFWLLAQNRFNNSKEFYEENKAEINRTVINAMRQIAAFLGPEMLKIDPMANVVPTKMVSRIRRDTRYTNDKTLYREHVWIMFMRPKALWENHPCIWFEISSGGYSYGVGFFDQKPALMEFFRKKLLEDTDSFLQAKEYVEKSGAILSADLYKREKRSDLDAQIKNIYNAKTFYFIAENKNIQNLEDERIIKELKKAFKNFAPMYKYLLKIADEFLAFDEELQEAKLKENTVKYEF